MSEIFFFKKFCGSITTHILKRAHVLYVQWDELLQTWIHPHNQDLTQETEKYCDPKNLPHVLDCYSPPPI